jgi:hypothetical protein
MERMAEEIVVQFGYLGLVVVSFVAATLVPVSSEVVIDFVKRSWPLVRRMHEPMSDAWPEVSHVRRPVL